MPLFSVPLGHDWSVPLHSCQQLSVGQLTALQKSSLKICTCTALNWEQAGFIIIQNLHQHTKH